jgi:hypothetical protein
MLSNTTAHVYGSSPSNQRIEAWWAFLRRNRSQWWIEFFANLVNQGLFHVGHARETDLLRFCFRSLIRQDLRNVADSWNAYRIRPSRGSLCPAGVPNELFFLSPSTTANYLQIPTKVILPQVLQQVKKPTVCADSTFGNFLMRLCELNNFNKPQTIHDATTLYTHLLRLI